MSKQIALLIDNSGSMFVPVGGANPNTKIFETARGAELFIQNLIDRQNAAPGQFAFSLHRFATSYQLFPAANGGASGSQVDSGSANFTAQLANIKTSVATIEDSAATQAAVGFMTDLYEAVRQTAAYMIANPPGFGAPTSRVLFLFTDGIQTIPHGPGTGLTMANYEAAAGVTFNVLLNGQGIKLVAWGVGSDALGVVLDELKNQAVPGGTNPVSASKVLFPIDATGTFPNCTTSIVNAALAVVNNNGVLPLNPVGQPPSGLLWEQFSLPSVVIPAPQEVTFASALAPRQVNFRDFEVAVDGSTKELILGLVWSHPGSAPTIQATSPAGAAFAPGDPGTRQVTGPTGLIFTIDNPAKGTWGVRVVGDPHQTPLVLDLMARGVFREFSLEVEAVPFQILKPGIVKVIARPRLDGKPAKGKLTATALVLGGGPSTLKALGDGSFAGPAEITHPGMTPIRVEVDGKLDKGGTVRRIEFAVVLLGPATDPRLTLRPDTYEQGGSYRVEVRVREARFKHNTQITFGSGIAVSSFQVLSDSVASAQIRVARDAFVGARVVATYSPAAESDGAVQVVAAPDGRGMRGRVCCLRFDAGGRLIAVVLCDGEEIKITEHEDRIVRLLETARDEGATVSVSVDDRGRLVSVSICRPEE